MVRSSRDLPARIALTGAARQVGHREFCADTVGAAHGRLGRFVWVREAIVHNYIFNHTTKQTLDHQNSRQHAYCPTASDETLLGFGISADNLCTCISDAVQEEIMEKYR
ncbi:MAG: hypothetical protein RR410_00090 [Alistipes sp.]